MSDSFVQTIQSDKMIIQKVRRWL